MTINDILTLSRAGFSAQTIERLVALERQTAQPAAPAPTTNDTSTHAQGIFDNVFDPARETHSSFPSEGAGSSLTPAPASSVQDAGPVTPPASPMGMEQLVQQMQQMQDSINALRVPQAGSVGTNPQPVTSLEDIILGPLNLPTAPAPNPYATNTNTTNGGK